MIRRITVPLSSGSSSQVTLPGLPDHEDKGTTILQNIRNHLPNDILLHSIWLGFSATLVKKPQCRTSANLYQMSLAYRLLPAQNFTYIKQQLTENLYHKNHCL